MGGAEAEELALQAAEPERRAELLRDWLPELQELTEALPLGELARLALLRAEAEPWRDLDWELLLPGLLL